MTSGADRRGPSLLEGNPRARVLLPIFLVVLVALFVQRMVIHDRGPVTVEFAGPTMGTRYLVKVVLPEVDGRVTGAISDAVEARLAEVNRQMSTYDPESVISRFNAARTTDPVPVPPEFLTVYEIARLVHERSEGAFDVTVGPLVQLWGFGPAGETPLPTEAELAAARERVGSGYLEAGPGTLRKTRPDVEIDFSAVAKGFGVDEVARVLERLGQDDYLVEIGGEIRSAGHRDDGQPWRVAIERPDPARRAVHHVIELGDAALATSGDYRNFHEEDGTRLTHIIDPRTGRPVTHTLASTSVVADDCATADAWATALLVLGPEEGLRVAEARGLAAYLIVREPDGTLVDHATRAFAARFPEPEPEEVP